MKIGFDAKRIFHNRTGLGNYSRDLVRILESSFPQNDFFLYNPKQGKENLFVLPSKNVKEVRPYKAIFRFFYNLWRQFFIIEDLKRTRFRFHGLTGEIPYGLKSRYRSVVTIHDLIFMRYPRFYSFDRNIHRLKASYAVKMPTLLWL